MKLLRVLQTGFGIQSFEVFGQNIGAQQFLVDEGNYLLTTDMIVDMATGELKFLNGPRTVQKRVGRDLSERAERLLREQD